MKKLVLLSMGIYLIGCSASKNVVALSQADVDRVQTKYPGYTLAELNEGKVLYEKHCGNCHGLKPLNSQSEQGWNNVVPPMVQKANKKEGIEIGKRGEDLIIKYVTTMGPLKKGQ